MDTFSCGDHRNITVSHAQVPGSRHRLQNRICEDVVFQRTEGDLLFCGLADGQSGAEFGRDGGLAALEAVYGHIVSVGIGALLRAPFPDELPCAFVRAYREKLLALARDRGTGLADFASTLLAVAVDLRSGNYMLLHLGDGCAVCVSDGSEPLLFSRPENGATPCHTWLTSSDSAVSHFRVSFGCLDHSRRLFLMSDGATCLCRGRCILRRSAALLRSGSHQQLREHLLRSDPSDDATCIFLDLQNPVSGNDNP